MLNFNKDQVLGKWKEIAGEVQKKWGDISSDELVKIKGNATALVGLLQQRLGISKEDAEKKVMQLLEKAQVKSGDFKEKAEGIKEKAEETAKMALGMANSVLDQMKNKLKK